MLQAKIILKNSYTCIYMLNKALDVTKNIVFKHKILAFSKTFLKDTIHFL